MADRYDTFEDLAADLQEGVDYRIRSSDRGTSVVTPSPPSKS